MAAQGARLSRAVLSGQLVQCEEVNWAPLENVLDLGACRDFMWMHEVELEDGTRLHAYKHYWNRRYLHLSARGEAFIFVWKVNDPDYDSDDPGEYEPLQLHRALSLVLGRPRWPAVQDAEERRIAWEREDAANPETLH